MREILLVEDSASDAELLKRALRAAKVANPVRHLLDGNEALQFIQSRDNASPVAEREIPSILFLDLKLPGASGFDILRYLQPSVAFALMLKIVVSDLRHLQEIRKAYSLGAQSFLAKPANPQDLQELIKTYPDYWELE